jgi:intracellular sulfur oxidation DsrE/DsrF family protein
MLKHKSKWSALLIFFALIIGGTQLAAAAQDKPFADTKVVLQISDPNPFKQTLILNVASNMIKHFGTDKVAIEVVAFGPGLRLLFADNANSGRIDSLQAEGVVFHGCSNTLAKMTNVLGYKPALHKDADASQGGVVTIMQLVNNGYTLIKP